MLICNESIDPVFTVCCEPNQSPSRSSAKTIDSILSLSEIELIQLSNCIIWTYSYFELASILWLPQACRHCSVQVNFGRDFNCIQIFYSKVKRQYAKKRKKTLKNKTLSKCCHGRCPESDTKSNDLIGIVLRTSCSQRIQMHKLIGWVFS